MSLVWNGYTQEEAQKKLKETKVLLVDLDGTLVDSDEGILNALEYALRKMGVASFKREDLYPFIGPPLRDSFQKKLGMTEAQSEICLIHYRKYYISQGMYECKAYDQVETMCNSLIDKGLVLSVATSKPWAFAHRILRYLGLRSYFDTVFGCYRDGRLDSKAEVVEACLKHYEGRESLPKGRLQYAKSIPPTQREHILMLGDRYYDVVGAQAHGVDTLGVSYGYGSREELLKHGAMTVIDSPMAVVELFR